MKNTVTAKQCALNCCQSINRLTGLGLKAIQRSDNNIDLLCEQGSPLDTFKSWEEARIALWASFLIVESSFLKNTLLADNAQIGRRLAVSEKKLAEKTVELKSVQADRDHFLLTAVRFARLVDLDSD